MASLAAAMTVGGVVVGGIVAVVAIGGVVPFVGFAGVVGVDDVIVAVAAVVGLYSHF